LLDNSTQTAVAVASSAAFAKPPTLAPPLTPPITTVVGRGELLVAAGNITTAAAATMGLGQTFLCEKVGPWWQDLAPFVEPSTGRDSSRYFRDGLVWSADKQALALDTILSSGHNALLSAQLFQVLVNLAKLTASFNCTARGLLVPRLREVAANISSGFASRVLWNSAVGMYVDRCHRVLGH
jgi:hypothetical protein